MSLPVSISDLHSVAPDQTIRTRSDGVARSFSVCTGLFTPVANPTDVLCILPVSFPLDTLKLRRVAVSGVSQSGGSVPVRVVFGANGGFAGVNQLTLMPRNRYDGGSCYAVWRMTANRSNVGVGAADTRTIIDEADLVFGTEGSSAGSPAVFEFGRGAKSPTIPHQYDVISVSFSGATLPTGAKVRITLEWEEMSVVNVSFVGDSTTSNATPDLLNGSTNAGGMGRTGALNELAKIDNHGSNGYRIFDFLNGTNGVTVPLSQLLNWTPDVYVLCYGINDARQGSLGADIDSCTNRLTAMIDTAVNAVLNGTLNGGAYTSPKATKYTVQSAAWASNTVTLQTSTPHGYATTETLKLAVTGMVPNAFNGVYTCTFPTATGIQYTLGSNPGAATAMGTVAFTTIWSTTAPGNLDAKVILWSPNSICADDLGDTPGYGSLSLSGQSSPTAMTGLWSGMTVAQAAQALTNMLYAAYQSFSADSRIYALLHKQDVLGRQSLPIAQMPWMVNQLHPGPRGRILTRRQVLPVLKRAIQDVRAIKV